MFCLVMKLSSQVVLQDFESSRDVLLDYELCQLNKKADCLASYMASAPSFLAATRLFMKRLSQPFSFEASATVNGD